MNSKEQLTKAHLRAREIEQEILISRPYIASSDLDRLVRKLLVSEGFSELEAWKVV